MLSAVPIWVRPIAVGLSIQQEGSGIMNHIVRLTTDLASAQAELRAKDEAIPSVPGPSRPRQVQGHRRGRHVECLDRDPGRARLARRHRRRGPGGMTWRMPHEVRPPVALRLRGHRSQAGRRDAPATTAAAALPLLGSVDCGTQPSIDEVMDSRVATWITGQQAERDRRAGLWRRGRRQLDAHAPASRAALLTYWNGHRWLPGDPGYLLDMLRIPVIMNGQTVRS